MTTDKTPATLATAKHGGCVQLGDGLVPRYRHKFNEWWSSQPCDISRLTTYELALTAYQGGFTAGYLGSHAALTAHPSPSKQSAHCPVKHCGMTYARVPADGRCHACGATVQPSPGGQGDALREAAEFARSVLAEIYATYQVKIGPFASQAQLANVKLGVALAARQPVGVDAATLRVLADRWANDRNYTGSPVDDIRALIDEPTPSRQPMGEPVAWLIERLRGKGYGRDKYVVMKGQTSSDPDSHLFWTDQQAQDNHRVTPLYARPAQAVDLPYSLDADPAGIRARVADAITGTLMVGAQGHTPPPAGHWAEPFWQAARADARVQEKTREALLAATRSLRTIADSTKETEFLETAGEIRAYAGSRANCAEQVLTDSRGVKLG